MLLSLPAPYDSAAIRDFLRSRAIPGVELVQPTDTGWRYDRAVGAGILSIDVHPTHLIATATPECDLNEESVAAHARNVFDLDSARDPRIVDEALSAHPASAPLIAARPGLRVPGAVDAHELAFRAVIGQQISVAAASAMCGRIARSYGTALSHTESAPTLTHQFPTAAQLAAVDPTEFAMPRSRAATIHALATALADGQLDLRVDSDPDVVRSGLQAVKGIGPWTAGYVTMRACRDSDVLLASDLIVRRSAEDLGLPHDPRDLAAAGAQFSPWRSYVTMHLWAAYSR